MKVLLDESVPRGLKAFLPNHEVRTVVEQGWKSRRSGELREDYQPLAVESAEAAADIRPGQLLKLTAP